MHSRHTRITKKKAIQSSTDLHLKGFFLNKKFKADARSAQFRIKLNTQSSHLERKHKHLSSNFI